MWVLHCCCLFLFVRAGVISAGLFSRSARIISLFVVDLWGVKYTV